MAASHRWLDKIKDYFDDLQRGDAPRHLAVSRKQVQATTAVVIVAVFAFAAYFAVVDLLLGRGINQIFQSLARGKRLLPAPVQRTGYRVVDA